MFKNAFCQVPLTLPSHTSLLTGTYPATTGVRINGTAFGTGVTTLGEAFQAKGYRTAAFVSALVLDSGFGLSRGFETYDDDLASSEAIERPADKATDAAIRWLSTSPEKPFFAWVHFFDPHSPHTPPEDYRSKFADPYDGEIAFVDSQIARLLQWLDQAGLRDSTMIVVAGDHGEAFDEHGENEHGLFVYDSTMHVPLVLSMPGVLPHGTAANQPVGLIDLFPTIAELLRWEPTEGLEGRSLTPEWQARETTPRLVYGESEYPRLGFGWSPLRSLTTGQWKYIEAPRRELYDRLNDPKELVNVIDAQPELAMKMQATLREAEQSMVQRAVRGTVQDREIVGRLQSLGYVSGGSTPSQDDEPRTRRDPKDMVELYRSHSLAVHLLLEGQYARVATIMEPLVQQSPESDEFFNTLGTAYLELGRPADAERAFATSLRIASDNPRRLWRMGEALFRQNKLDDATRHLEAALAISPSLAVAHCTLGDILAQRGKSVEALSHYEAAVAASDQLGKAHGRLGVAYAQQQKFAAAEKHLRRYVELEPTSAHALTNLGNVLYQMRRPEEAAALLQKALQYDRMNAAAHMSLFQAYLALGKPKEAIQALREARKAIPQESILTFKLAWLLATTSREDLRNPVEAQALARELSAGRTSNADILALLAATDAAMGNYEQAVSHARNAISIAQSKGDAVALRRFESQLKIYEAGKPYRE